MHRFNSNGVEIAYDDLGEGPPILLIHGFASNGRVNWRDTGWERLLLDSGRRVITIDNRGHGESQKLYAPDDYTAQEMAEDSYRLLVHLNIPAADVMGYSMGARIAAFVTLHHAERVRRAVFAGLASRMISGVGGGEAIADGLEAPSLADVEGITARAFRIFAEQTKSDRRALAACMRSARPRITAEALAAVRVPVLVVAGEQDDVAGSVEGLTSIIPGSRGVVLPGRNHMNAVGDKLFKSSVLDFLAAG